jgi:uncharacterized protein YndB with AHSA1/START domain
MSFDYTVSKVVDAPVSKVWKAWTEPAGYAGIFHARPETVKINPRPGGRFEVTMVTPDNSEVPMSGTYREVVPNKRLVTTMDLPDGETSPMVMELEEVDGGTKIIFTQSCSSAEERDFAKEGSEVLLEWCADHLAKA